MSSENKESTTKTVMLSYLIAYLIYALIALLPVWFGLYDYEEAMTTFLIMAIIDFGGFRLGKAFKEIRNDRKKNASHNRGR